MRLVTRFEAAASSTARLRGLLRGAFIAAASAPPRSQERRNLLISIRNIEIELARRSPGL